MGMGIPVGLPELTILWLTRLVFYLLPYAITIFALLKLIRLSREVGEIKMLVINLKETIDRANR